MFMGERERDKEKKQDQNTKAITYATRYIFNSAPVTGIATGLFQDE